MKATSGPGIILAAAMLALLALAPACAGVATVTVTAATTITATVEGPTATVTVLPNFAPATGTYASNGARIYLTATSASGQAIASEGYMTYPRYITCADCHGVNGKGGSYMMMQLSDVTWTALTDSKQHNPPYSDEGLRLSIVQGVDSSGALLSAYMPRWQMTTQDLIDLVAFIKTLK
jgi:mono/diheme cytochrome c family protein